MDITRYVLPVVVGAMAGMILITAGEAIVQHLYPPSPGTDLHDVESLARYILALPEGAYSCKLADYVTGSFLAGLTSTLVSARKTIKPAFIVAIILTLAGLYYIINMPYPRWFAIASAITYFPATLLGYFVVRKKSSTPAV
jgi:hypothetical protein